MERYTAKILSGRIIGTYDFDASDDDEALANATRLAGDIKYVLSVTTADVMGHGTARLVYERGQSRMG